MEEKAYLETCKSRLAISENHREVTETVHTYLEGQKSFED